MLKLILASGSPRRRQLLTEMGFEFEVITQPVDESPLTYETAAVLTLRLALLKAQAVLKVRPQNLILGADTAVECQGRILGKPKDDKQAYEMLTLLSGRQHRVYTSVALVSAQKVKTQTVSCAVNFDALSPDLIKSYIASGECSDKAGAYALQGRGGMLIRSINGSMGAVIGLPQCQTRQMLQEFGLKPKF